MGPYNIWRKLSDLTTSIITVEQRKKVTSVVPPWLCLFMKAPNPINISPGTTMANLASARHKGPAYNKRIWHVYVWDLVHDDTLLRILPVAQHG